MEELNDSPQDDVVVGSEPTVANHDLDLDLDDSKDRLLRYNDKELELQFMEFLRPHTSGSLIVVLLHVFVFMFLLDMTSPNTDKEQSAFLIAVGLINIFVTGLVLIGQATLVVAENFHLVSRTGPVNQISEWIMVLGTFINGIATRIYVSDAAMTPDCTKTIVYKSSGDHGVYDAALCQRQFATYACAMAFFLTIRRQRFASIAVFTALTLLSNLIMALVYPQRPDFPLYHWLTLVFFVGMLLFAFAARYDLESAERNYFEAQQRLRRKQQLLETLSAEVTQFVSSLLPPGVVSRSIRANTKTTDVAQDAIVVVMSVADFAKQAADLLAMELYTQLLLLQQFAVEHAQQRGLQKVLSLNDELVFIANLLERHQPLKTLLSAIEAALVATRSNSYSLRLRAAVHLGGLRGGFHGGSWIRYDISGPALSTSRAAACHAISGEVLLTEDALTASNSHAFVTEGPLLDDPEGDRLWVVQGCTPPETIDFISSLCESPGNASGNNSGSDPKAGLTSPLNSDPYQANPLVGLRAATEATRAAADLEAELAEVSTWVFFHRFVEPAVEQEFLRVRMVTMTQRAVRIWCAFAWLQLVLIGILIADFHPESGERSFFLLLVSIGLTLVVALTPTFLTVEGMHKYHTPWSLLALFVPLITSYGIAASRPSALGIDPRPMMMVGALLRVPCLYYERHQIIVVPLFMVLSLTSYLLPGGGLTLWTFPYMAIPLYFILTSSEGEHAQRRNFVAQKQTLLTLRALESEHDVRQGLVRATLPATILREWFVGSLDGRNAATLVPDTLVVCVSASSMEDEKSLGRSAQEVVFTTERLVPVEEAAGNSGVLNIVKVVGDLCVLVSPIAIPGRKLDNTSEATAEAIYDVLLAMLDLCSDGRYGALLDIDESVQVLSTTGLPTHAVFGVVLTRLLSIAAATSDSWSGFSVLERSMAAVREGCGDLSLIEKPQPPLRIRGVGMLRLVKLALS